MSRLRALHPLARLTLLALIVVGAFATLALTGPLTAARVHGWIGGGGVLAALSFIALSSSLTVACFPGPLLAGAAGALFGVVEGTLLATASATLGAVLAFCVARAIAGDAVRRIGGTRLNRAATRVGDHSFLAVLFARIAPGVPYTMVNYVAGLSPVGLGAFAAATLIGCAPRAFAYAALGGSLGNLGSPQALAALGVLVAMALGGSLSLAWRERRATAPAPETDSSSPGVRLAGRL